MSEVLTTTELRERAIEAFREEEQKNAERREQQERERRDYAIRELETALARRFGIEGAPIRWMGDTPLAEFGGFWLSFHPEYRFTTLYLPCVDCNLPVSAAGDMADLADLGRELSRSRELPLCEVCAAPEFADDTPCACDMPYPHSVSECPERKPDPTPYVAPAVAHGYAADALVSALIDLIAVEVSRQLAGVRS